MIFLRAAALLSLSWFVAACEAPVSLGRPCTRASECGAPLVCQFARCRSECVENRDCPTGATCLPVDGAGVCSVDVDLGCETGVGRMCASGLTCLSDRCVATCASPADCPTDGECRPSPVPGVSFCFDPRLPTADAAIDRDTGVADAGTDDASARDGGASQGCTSVCIEGGDHERACAICDGRVLCWGYDGDEGLGDGVGITTSGLPVAVRDESGAALAGFSDVVCGEQHACALSSTGVYCWGFDDGHGTLGRVGANVPFAIPVTLALGGPEAIVAGEHHTCARYADGEIRCWGENIQGQCDPNVSGYALEATVSPTTEHFEADARPFGATTFPVLAASRARTCAVTADRRTMFCVGLGEFTNTGVVSLTELVTAHGGDAIPLPADTTELAMGRGQTCMLAGQRAYCFGFDVFGSLGIPEGPPLRSCIETNPCIEVPTALTALAGVDLVVIGSGASSDHTCAGTAAGDLYCWGLNATGQCGAFADDRHAPSLAGFHRTVTHIATGQRSTCVTTDDGEVHCWGGNDDGQLGRGPADAVLTPHPEAVQVGIPSSP